MKDEAIYRRLFRTALLIRLVEERIIALYPSDRIQSPVHLSIGQEAVAAGVCDALRADDLVFATYRSHGFYIAKGGKLDAMFAELYGHKDGISGGKAGSMHLAAPEVGLMGSSAVVASTIPHAVGAALSFKRRGSSRIAVAVFGDGATEEGVYHESLNFAALMNVPVLFLCEDNGLAVHSHRHVRQSYRLIEHAATYGIAGRRLEEGWDMLAVREATLEAASHVRTGQPFILEIATSRYKEHVGVGEDFHFNYRTSDSVDAWKRRDPLIVDAELAAELGPDLEREIDAAVAYAEASPAPGRAELLTDVILMSLAAAKPLAQASRVVSYAGALLGTMDAALRDHPNVFVMGQGVDDFKGIFGSTTGLVEKYGAKRVFDVPLMEEGMTGVAIGAALVGDYPITTHIRADFSFLAMNQIINLAAKYSYMFGGLMRCPMLIRIVVGRSWGQGAQHSQSPQATFAHYPGLTVVMPSSSHAVLDMYPAIINRHPGPVISIEHRLLYNLDFTVSAADKRVPLKSYVARPGNDVTVVATSVMVLEALRAAQYVQDQTGISAEIIDLNSISHPDWDLVAASVGKTGRLVIADTSWLEYGMAGEVCRQLMLRDPALLKKPPSMLGMAPAPCPTAKSLEDIYYPSQHETVDAILIQVRGEKHGVDLPVERSMTEGYKRFRGPF